MRVETHKFVAVHGRKPQGAGRWAFELTGTTESSGLAFKKTFWDTGNFAMSCLRAVREARETGATKVRVLA